jgi:hypothetical protein
MENRRIEGSCKPISQYDLSVIQGELKDLKSFLDEILHYLKIIAAQTEKVPNAGSGWYQNL